MKHWWLVECSFLEHIWHSLVYSLCFFSSKSFKDDSAFSQLQFPPHHFDFALSKVGQNCFDWTIECITFSSKMYQKDGSRSPLRGHMRDKARPGYCWWFPSLDTGGGGEREGMEVGLSCPQPSSTYMGSSPKQNNPQWFVGCIVGELVREVEIGRETWAAGDSHLFNVNRKGERPFVLVTTPWWFRVSPEPIEKVIITMKITTVNINWATANIA